MTNAIAKVEEAKAGGALTVSQRKAFLEMASRCDLDKLPEPERRAALVAFGVHTGLRAELGEVMIFQGRFYVTMAGRIRNAHKNGLFDGARARPASLLERRNAGYADDDVVWVCDVWRRGASQPFRGWGKVTRAEIDQARAHERKAFTPVAQHPVEMARKRAEYDALRLAFPLDEELSEQAARFIAEAEVLAHEPRERPLVDAGAEILEDELAGKEPAPASDRSASPEGGADVQR